MTLYDDVKAHYFNVPMTGDILEDVKRVCTANQATHAYLWRHLLNVANEAKKLAKRFDFDEEAMAQFFINYLYHSDLLVMPPWLIEAHDFYEDN